MTNVAEASERCYKVITTADVLFSTRNQVKSQKKVIIRLPQMSYIPRNISKNKVYISVSVLGPHEMISP